MHTEGQLRISGVPHAALRQEAPVTRRALVLSQLLVPGRVHRL